MTSRPQVPPALRALLETGGALIRQSSSGRTLLGRAAGLLRDEAFPPVMRRAPGVLEEARVAASVPLDAKSVRAAERAVDELDPTPLAVTPAGQVHRGELDGQAVAVRIRRPGLERAVRNDLALLEALAPAAAAAFPAADTGAVLRAIRERSLDELDFEHEAAMQRAVARALRSVAGLRVPAAHTDAGEASLLIVEHVSGPTLADAAPPEAGPVARALVDAHVRAARAGLAPVDPRPNHVMLTADGVVLLGAGNAAVVDRDRVRALLDALEALRADDAEAFAQVVADRLALLPRRAAPAAHGLMRELLGELLEGPAALDDAALAAMGERTIARLGAVAALAAQVAPQPGDLWLARMAGQLTGTLARLGATEDWVALALSAR